MDSNTITTLLETLIETSPYGAFAILCILIMQRNFNKQLKMMKEMYEKSFDKNKNKQKKHSNK